MVEVTRLARPGTRSTSLKRPYTACFSSFSLEHATVGMSLLIEVVKGVSTSFAVVAGILSAVHASARIAEHANTTSTAKIRVERVSEDS